MKPIQLHLIVESTALTLIRYLTSKFVPLQSGAQAHQQVVIPALWMGRDTRGTKTYITESGALLVMVLKLTLREERLWKTIFMVIV